MPILPVVARARARARIRPSQRKRGSIRTRRGSGKRRRTLDFRMRPARDCARAALFPIRNPQSNIRNDPMRCNIDTKGKLARLIWGLALLIVGVLLLIFWARPRGGGVA